MLTALIALGVVNVIVSIVLVRAVWSVDAMVLDVGYELAKQRHPAGRALDGGIS